MSFIVTQEMLMSSVKRQIIALGGSGFSMEDSPLLDQYILGQTAKPNPKVCFVGTASGDAEDYIGRFYTAFSALDCRPTHLSLFKLPTRDLQSFVLEQDVIYVGGGNTRSLLALWREWSLDVYLRQAWEQGIVLAGLSAGAVCWFEQGLSDFFPGELNTLNCLGFLKGSHIPHYDGESNRRPTYHHFIAKGKISEGIAAADKYKLKLIIEGGDDAIKVAKELKEKNIPVVPWVSIRIAGQRRFSLR